MMKIFWVFWTLGDLAGKYQAFRGSAHPESKDVPEWVEGLSIVYLRGLPNAYYSRGYVNIIDHLRR